MTSSPPPGTAVLPPTLVLPAQPHPFWTREQVARALGTGPRGPQPFGAVVTDTRRLHEGDCFIALVGDQHDAHDFLAEARDRGAAALVVSDPTKAVGLGLPVYIVPDTLVALGQLATAWRRAWGRPVLGVVGSNGKTSTKDLIAAALRGTLEVHATAGNLNNLIGVPLTLLAVPAHADVAVVEMGTNTPGEIARLRTIAEPNVTVLTSIGEEHLEGLGDLAGVLREECAAFDDVPVAVVAASAVEAIPEARLRAGRVWTAGLSDADHTPTAWGLDGEGRAWLEVDGERVVLPVRGAHQAANAMLAIACARLCGVPIDAACRGMAGMPVPSMRGVWEPLGAAVMYNDAYNANPASMRAALALLAQLDGARPRVAILGTMRELGIHAAAQHRDVARAALASGASLIGAIGEFVEAFAQVAPGDARVIGAPDPEALWPLLMPRLPRDAVVLLKASRGVQLERLVPYLTTWAADASAGAPSATLR